MMPPRLPPPKALLGVPGLTSTDPVIAAGISERSVSPRERLLIGNPSQRTCVWLGDCPRWESVAISPCPYFWMKSDEYRYSSSELAWWPRSTLEYVTVVESYNDMTCYHT